MSRPPKKTVVEVQKSELSMTPKTTTAARITSSADSQRTNGTSARPRDFLLSVSLDIGHSLLGHQCSGRSDRQQLVERDSGQQESPRDGLVPEGRDARGNQGL